jgi:hypothetical protein
MHAIWNAAVAETNVLSISLRALHAGAMDEFVSSSFGSLKLLRKKRDATRETVRRERMRER